MPATDRPVLEFSVPGATELLRRHVASLESRVARLERMAEQFTGRRCADAEARRALEIVSRITGITTDAMLGRCRQAGIVNARHLAWYVLLEQGTWSAAAVARLWDTAVSTLNEARHITENRMATEPRFAEMVLRAVEEFNRP